ncbi:uncharacterized protein [Macrobrachium rosenbergii]|uniref:uncharacterized protein n=1 Tax=Macrobrachium rosenbergii TaxID=79674 RepID=UPI0034D3F1C1
MREADLEENDSSCIFTVKTVASIKMTKEQTVTLKVSPLRYIRFQIDCGADCNVLPLHVYQAATGDSELKEVGLSSTTLYVYGQKGIRSFGSVCIRVWRGVRTINLKCELLQGQRFHSILGYQACVAFNILEIKDNDQVNPICDKALHVNSACSSAITKELLIERHPQVFRGVAGKLDYSYKIRVNKSVNPVQHAPRRVPAPVRSVLQKELDKLESGNIIAKVQQPTESSCVHSLGCETRFLACAFGGGELVLTTFNTPFGRYRWLRMPFGICSAPEVFQRCMHQLIEDLRELRDLLHKNSEFVWQDVQKKAFKAVKEAASKTPVLRYYSLISEVTIQCDASQYGVGAALLQNGQPVAFASRSLSEAEQHYAQIEKECLAIVFECERFHHYVYGRDKVTVHSDHQPLELIFKKPLAAAPARLQRMLLHLQYYALEVKYVKGKHMYIADTLSRAFLPNCSENSVFVNYLETVKNEATTLIGDTLMITDDRLQEIKAHSGSDGNLQAVAKMIRAGWPDARNKAPGCARAFYNYRDELHTEDGLVFKEIV